MQAPRRGPTIQYFIGVADHAVKWSLPHRGANPGISDGDVFIQNDPYIAALNQMDTAIYGPVYWYGQIFAWAFNNAHRANLGGSAPGELLRGRQDNLRTANPWPPTKLVRGGEKQQDILQLFRWQSRIPEICELQMRAQVAGINTARARMPELLEEYGPRVVKWVMRRLIAGCSQAVTRRLLHIPDGDREHVTYACAGNLTDLAKVRLAIRRKGEELTFTNPAPDPKSHGWKNCTCNSFRAAALCAMNTFLGRDRFRFPAGVLNHLRIERHPETIMIAKFPAGFTVLYGISVCEAQAALWSARCCFAVLPSCARGQRDWELRRPDGHLTPRHRCQRRSLYRHDCGSDWWRIRRAAHQGRSGSRSCVLVASEQLRQCRGMGSGDTDGLPVSPPAADMGGGPASGGNGIETALIGHKVRTFINRAGGNQPAINVIQGLAGGLPGHSGQYCASKDTSIGDVMASGVLPASRELLEKTLGAIPLLLPGESKDIANDGVIIVRHQAGGGLGDPLLRDVDVVEDVLRGGMQPHERPRRMWRGNRAGPCGSRGDWRLASRNARRATGRVGKGRLMAACNKSSTVLAGTARSKLTAETKLDAFARKGDDWI